MLALALDSSLHTLDEGERQAFPTTAEQIADCGGNDPVVAERLQQGAHGSCRQVGVLGPSAEQVDHGFAKTARFTSPGEPSLTEEGQDVGGLFLIGVAGQIFEIRQDYQFARPAAPYSAVGSGASVPLGALHALEAVPDLSLRERAAMALEAAEAYSAAVRGPFHFVELPPAPALDLCEIRVSSQP